MCIINLTLNNRHKHYTTNVQTKHIQTTNQQAYTTTKLAHQRKKNKGKNNYPNNQKCHKCSKNSKISTTINGTKVSAKGVAIARSDDVGTM
jgi:hypothetical protein